MSLELAEKLIQSIFALLSQVMSKKVCDVQQKVFANLPCTVPAEHGEVVGVRVNCKLRVCKADCWASF